MTEAEGQNLQVRYDHTLQHDASQVGQLGDGAGELVTQQEFVRDNSRRRVSFSNIDMVHNLPGHSTSSEGDSSWRDAAAAEAADSPSSKSTGCWAGFKLRVKALKRDITALYYAVHHPDTPWYSKLLPWLVLAYALSPLDLIPDFIPVLGILDDMLLLPLGLWISYRLIPTQVMLECRERAAHEPLLLHRNWLVATVIFLLWTSGLLLLVHWLVMTYGNDDLQRYEWAALAGSGGIVTIVFVVWLVSRIRYEAHRREEFNVSLLSAQHDCDCTIESNGDSASSV